MEAHNFESPPGAFPGRWWNVFSRWISAAAGAAATTGRSASRGRSAGFASHSVASPIPSSFSRCGVAAASASPAISCTRAETRTYSRDGTVFFSIRWIAMTSSPASSSNRRTCLIAISPACTNAFRHSRSVLVQASQLQCRRSCRTRARHAANASKKPPAWASTSRVAASASAGSYSRNSRAASPSSLFTASGCPAWSITDSIRSVMICSACSRLTCRLVMNSV